MTQINSTSSTELFKEIQNSFKDDNRIDKKELNTLKEMVNNSDLDSATKQGVMNLLEHAKKASDGFLWIFGRDISNKEMVGLKQDLEQLKNIVGDNPVGKELCDVIENSLPNREVQTNSPDNSSVVPHKSHDSNPVSDFFSKLFSGGKKDVQGQSDNTNGVGNRKGLLRNDVASFHLTQYTGSESQKGDCGPTSGAMVLRAFGINASVQDVRNNVTDDKPTKAPWALREDQIASSVEKLSNGAVKQSGDTEHYKTSEQNKLIDDIKQQLSEGKLPILCTGVPSADADSRHYIVITGIDDQGNLQYADPAISQNGSGPAYMTPDQLTQRMANAKGLGKDTTLTTFEKLQ